MSFSDIFTIIQWWTIFFAIGAVFLPLTFFIFSSFFDKGYVFAKILGIAVISYAVFVLGFLKILPFNQATIFVIIAFFAGINLLILKKYFKSAIKQPNNATIGIFLFEEILFLAVLLFWSWIHAHQPDIHGLEKYMDFGFINSILRTDYFPPKDMWFTPFPINYYYFGHLVTAVLTKISNIPSSITFNLMLSTITALGFVSAFSIGANLMGKIKNQKSKIKDTIQSSKIIIGGLLAAFLVSFGGNLHAIYLFFKPYVNDNPAPFWQLLFSPQTFPNNYWYPNATRFIENTIHEFPIYSSVVSDLHGHFLDLPFVLLAIAILLSLINSKHETRSTKQIQKVKVQNSKRFGNFNFGYLKLFRISNFDIRILLLAFLLAIMYMTNVWDGFIYFLLAAIVIFIIKVKSTISLSKNKKYIIRATYYIILILVGFFIFSLPFNLSFKPFASGIGVICAPKFLTDIGRLGPFLFETGHCQRSPLWQLFILYGFFYFWVVSFAIFLFRFVILSRIKLGEGSRKILRFAQNDIVSSDIFILILIIFSTILIVIPEFIYVKDIYPAHYRANTMFKLVYQAFIMLSLTSGYIIIRLVFSIKYYVLSIKKKISYILYLILATLYLILVFLYPYFAINSYFGNLKNYSGLSGTKYLETLYPSDYEAILWINKNIKGQPVILEAQGDSYTDFARVSVNTGLPTVLGWTVHEWLWRGTYDIPSPRIADIAKTYESSDLKETGTLLRKYKVEYVFIGTLEIQKYPDLNEEKFRSLGKIVYQKDNTKIFRINQ